MQQFTFLLYTLDSQKFFVTKRGYDFKQSLSGIINFPSKGSKGNSSIFLETSEQEEKTSKNNMALIINLIFIV